MFLIWGIKRKAPFDPFNINNVIQVSFAVTSVKTEQRYCKQRSSVIVVSILSPNLCSSTRVTTYTISSRLNLRPTSVNQQCCYKTKRVLRSADGRCFAELCSELFGCKKWGISADVSHHLFAAFGCIFGSKHYSVLIQIKQGAFGSFASQLKENLKSTQTGALLQQEGEGLQSDREEVGAKPGQVIEALI